MAHSTMHDVVLYGATGFTGQLTAQYLAEHPQAPSIALAGRNLTKLRKVREQLAVPRERRDAIQLIEASAQDAASIQALARSAKVVINTVGPYMTLGGFEVVKAVVEAGAGYVDLAGESAYYARLVQELHVTAQKTRAVIVPSSAFDSLPFDLSTYFAVQEVKRSLGPTADVDRVECGFVAQGSFSGGSFASMAAMRKDPELLQYKHPYFLSPVQGTLEPKAFLTRYMPQFRKSGAFTLLSPHNMRVVNRSWGLLEEAKLPARYGPTFRYFDAFVAPLYVLAVLVSLVFSALMWVLLHVPRIDTILAALFPPGTGASIKAQHKGFLHVRAVAYARNGNTRGLAVFRVQGDPGYLKTAAFLAESALTIALERGHLAPLAQKGGILTPATVAPEIIAARLGKYAGVTIKGAKVSGSEDVSKVLV